MRGEGRIRWVIFCLIVGLVAGGAGMGIASHGDPDEIHACVKEVTKKRPGKPKVVFDKIAKVVEDPAECGALEVLTWNTEGPPGIQGPQGIEGTQGPEGTEGPQGPAGPAGASGIARAGWSDNLVDAQGDGGGHTSVAIGTDGYPLIAYHDSGKGDLLVAHCEDVACASVSETVLDATGDVGEYTSITIAPNGFGIVSYHDETNGTLKLARCRNVACTTAFISTIDDGSADVGEHTSIAIAENGFAQIAYHDDANGTLEWIGCTNVDCTEREEATLDDTSADVGEGVSLVMGRSFTGAELTMIGYVDATNSDVKLATRSGSGAAVTTTTEVVDGATRDVSGRTAVVAGRDGNALVLYRVDNIIGNQQIWAVHCTNAVCSAADGAHAVSSQSSKQEHLTATLGADGLPVFAFGIGHIVKVSACEDVECTGVVDNRRADGDVASGGSEDPAIVLGADGNLAIAYGAVDGVRLVHCADRLCVRNAWPR